MFYRRKTHLFHSVASTIACYDLCCVQAACVQQHNFMNAVLTYNCRLCNWYQWQEEGKFFSFWHGLLVKQFLYTSGKQCIRKKKKESRLSYIFWILMKVQHSISHTLLCHFCHLWTYLIFMVRDYDFLGNKSMSVCNTGVLRHVCYWVQWLALFILSFYSYRKEFVGSICLCTVIIMANVQYSNNSKCIYGKFVTTSVGIIRAASSI